MIAALARPLSLLRLVSAAALICVSIAVYCLFYSALAGRPESFGQALSWALVNILPWLLALEAGKRSRKLGWTLLLLGGALVLSLLLGWLLRHGLWDWGFEAIRRLPALAATVALLLALRFVAVEPMNGSDLGLPLQPAQIDWVSAAGNYVEFRNGSRTWLRRASLSSVERALNGHGFVRIHRCTLVRRDRIARVRPVDVVLHDGTSLKTGKRYRSALDS